MEKIVEREMMKSFEPAFECLYLGATSIAEDLGYKKGLPLIAIPALKQEVEKRIIDLEKK